MGHQEGIDGGLTNDLERQLPVAAPVASLPLALPIEVSGFPFLRMSRLGAALDAVGVLVLLNVYMILLGESGVPQWLEERMPSWGRFSSGILVGLCGLALVSTALVLRRQAASSVGLNRPSGSRLLIGAVVALPACYAASIGGTMLYILLSGMDMTGMVEEKSELLEMVKEFPTAWVLPLCVFVGVSEEVLFRGFLLSRLRTATGSAAAAVIVSSLVFGLMHIYQGLLGVVQTSAVGLALAIVATYARTLWPVILAHTGLDAISLYLAPTLQRLLEEVGST